MTLPFSRKTKPQSSEISSIGFKPESTSTKMRFRAKYTLHEEEFDAQSWDDGLEIAFDKSYKSIEDKLLKLEMIGTYDLVFKPIESK